MAYQMYLFNLSDEDDQYISEHVNNASSYHSALWDLREAIRMQVKYGEHEEEAAKAWDSIYDMFYDILGEHGVSL